METDAWSYQMVANVKYHPSKLLNKVVWVLNVISTCLTIGHDDLMHAATKLLIKKDSAMAQFRKHSIFFSLTRQICE